MNRWVLDASALLALLNRESGHGRVADALVEGAMMSTVNLSEVVAKLADSGLTEAEICEAIDPLGIDYAAFDEEGAILAGMLRPTSREVGLSLGDRACVALGNLSGLPVLTSDLAWNDLDLDSGVEIVMLR